MLYRLMLFYSKFIWKIYCISFSDPVLFLCCQFSEVGDSVSPKLIRLPPSQPAGLHREGTPGFMASDRKSIERTVCNPTITLSPNEETVIQSLSLYLSKTDFQLCNQVCLFKQITASLGSNYCAFWDSSVCFHNSFALICCFFLFSVMYSPSPASECWIVAII